MQGSDYHLAGGGGLQRGVANTWNLTATPRKKQVRDLNSGTDLTSDPVQLVSHVHKLREPFK